MSGMRIWFDHLPVRVQPRRPVWIASGALGQCGISANSATRDRVVQLKRAQ